MVLVIADKASVQFSTLEGWGDGQEGKKKNSVRWKCPCVFVCYCRCVRLLSLLPFKPMEDFHRRIIFTYEQT